MKKLNGKIRFLLGTSLLISGCANILNGPATMEGNQSLAKPAPANGPIDSVLGIDRYYPLDRTFTWTYRVTSLEEGKTTFAEDVTRIDSVSGSGSYKTATYTSSRRESGNLVAQGTGTISQNSSTLTISGGGGSETIVLPLTPGRTWTSGTLEGRCYSVGSLEVAGKTYKDVLAIAYTKDGETRAVRWMAPGVGVIKQLASIQMDGKKVEELSELLKAQVSAVTSVSMTPLSLSLSQGATASVRAQVFYDDGSIGREFSFSTRDPSVVTVNSEGLVRGILPGNTILTALSSQDSTKAATISIEVR
ncbi:MAG TPA: Ig-like domain-containing protein [Chroococcales cyanobacterium]|jgi:uncharacterized protein YjdB